MNINDFVVVVIFDFRPKNGRQFTVDIRWAVVTDESHLGRGRGWDEIDENNS